MGAAGQGSAFNAYSLLAARILICALFLISGLEKILSYQATAAFMEVGGVPAWLLPFVIALEVAAGIAVLVGFKTRPAALCLGLFSVLAAVLFHNDFSNKIHFILFWSDLAIAGGLLALVAAGPGPFSLDHRLDRRP